ncbi:MAG: hypothetical protein F9B45_30765 [Phycisphaera sp. RhM]|nr:hypothetical protein [Phycisphaera sp. RhM]
MIALSSKHLNRRLLTWNEIEAEAIDYPIAASIRGEVFRVDKLGLLTPGRAYPVCTMPAAKSVDRAVRWLERADAGRIKTPSISSYTLKHAAERWTGQYISNGAFIVAAHQRGFRMMPRQGSLYAPINMLVGMSKRVYYSLPESLEDSVHG